MTAARRTKTSGEFILLGSLGSVSSRDPTDIVWKKKNLGVAACGSVRVLAAWVCGCGCRRGVCGRVGALVRGCVGARVCVGVFVSVFFF